jgi:hypothetical protein
MPDNTSSVAGLRRWHAAGAYAVLSLVVAPPAGAQPVSVPATATLANKVDLGLFTAGPLEVTASGWVELYSPNHYLTFGDGALAVPFSEVGGITWTVEGGPYPTFAGGDGLNHYPGGGTNWNGSQWAVLSAESTDTRNPATIRFGTLVGTFNANPDTGDWFVIGRHGSLVVPAGGRHLFAAVVDCPKCPDNSGAYSVTTGSRIYSLSDDYDTTHNPSGPWSYGFRLASDPPGTFTPFADHFFGYVQVVGGWQGVSQYGDTLPGSSKNFSLSATTDGPTVWLPSELNMHPWITRECVSRFVAPATGQYSVSGSFRGMSVAGTTTTVVLSHGSSVLFQTNVIGYQTLVTMPTRLVALAAGDSLDLTVTKGPNNEASNDSTGVNLFIVAPSGCAADFNRDGTVNSTDVSDFINQWFQDQLDGTLLTDWDHNGVVNSTDVSDFINDWFADTAAGCG